VSTSTVTDTHFVRTEIKHIGQSVTNMGTVGNVHPKGSISLASRIAAVGGRE
jgi:hypothetical protein